MKYYLFSLILFFLISCNDNTSEESLKEEYNFTVLYDYTHPTQREDIYRSNYSSDNLYVFVESSFKHDTLKIAINDRSRIEEVVSSNLSSGLAKVITIDDIEKIKKFGFSINNSPEISFDIFNKKMNLIGVYKKNNNVTLRFYRRVPYLD
jgi:hypothetical protein